MNRIVVIEDDPAILTGLKATLRSEDYDVLTACDGENGYRLAQEARPDLVILDLMLPRLNGFDICRKLRGEGVVTPILMLTAQDQEARRIEGFEAGADDYVTKPFSVRELVGRVRAILRRSQGRSDLANQRELDEARHVQRRLIPTELPQLCAVRVAADWRPDRIAGGDYFDVLRLSEHALAVCIADVSGKGMPAAMMMSNLQAAVKAYVAHGARPSALCDAVNKIMCGNTASEGFISFVYAVIEDKPLRLTYCNAGHNPPVLISETGATVRQLNSGGGVLGVMPQWSYNEQEIDLSPGDRLVFYTDGITECRNAAGEELGEKRLIHIALNQHGGPHSVVEAIVEAAREYSNGNFEDDRTVIAVCVG